MSSFSETPHTPHEDDDVDDVEFEAESSTPFLRSVGALIQALRNQADLTQAEFGRRIGYGTEMVSKVERGVRIPKPPFIDNAERVLNAHGVLASLKEELDRASYAGTQRSIYREEARSTAIHAYDTHVVNALLQTEPYMRALFTMQTPPLAAGTVEERVAARLDRQKIFHREPAPPVTSFVMDEALLCRPFGGRDVLRGQLERLLELGRLPHVDLQVMPLGQEDNAGIGGPFTLMDTRKQTRIAYIEVQNTRIHTDRHRIRDLETTYSRIRAQALSPKDTLVFIEKLLKA